ncbi:4'-phosphopantetheinyl transferase superfamily protein [Catenulispora rubra]|uniref:4'-phosphopantetheinyl transferase superfamily protein n=1 Tax=Catenulispora rubra TaxID=280293 RepID=UPI001891FED6|nr:4'-phosphopantetheinyl transferase superfamily protein [Catenulispora rubra]
MRIGVDLMSVSRFARVAGHHRYRALVFTERELAEAGQLGSARYVERLAGRFCVKEATCKLLGRGFGQGLRWQDIEVCSDDWGAPSVALSGGALRLAGEAGVGEIAVTVTHQVDLVVAIAAAAESFAGDLGAASAQIMELLARHEERHGVRIPDSDFYQMTDLPGTGRAVARVASAGSEHARE